MISEHYLSQRRHQQLARGGGGGHTHPRAAGGTAARRGGRGTRPLSWPGQLAAPPICISELVARFENAFHESATGLTTTGRGLRAAASASALLQMESRRDADTALASTTAVAPAAADIADTVSASGAGGAVAAPAARDSAAAAAAAPAACSSSAPVAAAAAAGAAALTDSAVPSDTFAVVGAGPLDRATAARIAAKEHVSSSRSWMAWAADAGLAVEKAQRSCYLGLGMGVWVEARHVPRRAASDGGGAAALLRALPTHVCAAVHAARRWGSHVRPLWRRVVRRRYMVPRAMGTLMLLSCC